MHAEIQIFRVECTCVTAVIYLWLALSFVRSMIGWEVWTSRILQTQITHLARWSDIKKRWAIHHFTAVRLENLSLVLTFLFEIFHANSNSARGVAVDWTRSVWKRRSGGRSARFLLEAGQGKYILYSLFVEELWNFTNLFWCTAASMWIELCRTAVNTCNILCWMNENTSKSLQSDVWPTIQVSQRSHISGIKVMPLRFLVMISARFQHWGRLLLTMNKLLVKKLVHC